MGTASSPAVEENREINVAAKSQHSELLTVRNWLNEYQRFTVKVSTRDPDATVLIDTPKILGLPALMQRSLQLNFFAHLEGTTRVRVVLVNDATGEYLYYNLTFKTTIPEEQELASMQTSLRQRVSQQITIRNPLPQPVNITDFVCNDSSGLFIQTPVTIAANSQSQLTLQYRPLNVAPEHEEHVVLNTDLLGRFLYRLDVCATGPLASGSPSPPDAVAASSSDGFGSSDSVSEMLQFNARLGSSQKQVFRFVSFLPRDTEYEVSLLSEAASVTSYEPLAANPKDAKASSKRTAAPVAPTVSSDFIIVNRHITARAASPGGDGVPVTVEILYEPASLATHKEKLIVSAVGSSQQSAEYSCELVGRASPPKPQGPIYVQANKPADIRFKNVFNDTRNFNYLVDNAQFVLSRRSEQLGRKAQAALSVSFVPKAGAPVGQAVLGKLVISAQKEKAADADSWIYYLQAQV